MVGYRRYYFKYHERCLDELRTSVWSQGNRRSLGPTTYGQHYLRPALTCGQHYLRPTLPTANTTCGQHYLRPTLPTANTTYGQHYLAQVLGAEVDVVALTYRHRGMELGTELFVLADDLEQQVASTNSILLLL